jgi:hypothetical protein
MPLEAKPDGSAQRARERNHGCERSRDAERWKNMNEPRDCRLANHRAGGQERWKKISVDRLFAAKIVTRGESQGRPAHYLHS